MATTATMIATAKRLDIDPLLITDTYIPGNHVVPKYAHGRMEKASS